MAENRGVTRKVYLTFPRNKVPEALLWRASQLGQSEAIEQAVAILKERADDSCEKALDVLQNISCTQVITNVRGASVSDEIGIMAVELSGETECIERALTFLSDNGVKVEPIEKNVIE